MTVKARPDLLSSKNYREIVASGSPTIARRVEVKWVSGQLAIDANAKLE